MASLTSQGGMTPCLVPSIQGASGPGGQWQRGYFVSCNNLGAAELLLTLESVLLAALIRNGRFPGVRNRLNSKDE